MVNFREMPNVRLQVFSRRRSYFSRHAATAVRQVFFLAVVFNISLAAQNSPRADSPESSQPALLNYQELVTLYDNEKVDPTLTQKLDTLLTTPFVNNEASRTGAKPLRPDLKGVGPSLRLVQWNIERGQELDQIKLALSDKQRFLATARGNPAALSAQIDVLQSADVIVLNEVDWGMKRSGYQPVVEVLAQALKMNWVYGVEFVEVDPKVLGTQSFADVKDEAARKELEDEFSVDQSRLLGLHGTAILSRYPLRDVKLVPFKYQAYDWYNGEKRYGSLEAGKRKGAGLVFGEQMVREVRRGGRTTLIATIDMPDLPEHQVTIVAAHLENRTTPAGRVKQADELLAMLRPIQNPLIIAGDMNTTGTDGSVLSIKSAVVKKLNDPSFWATKGVKYATGVGFGMDVAAFAFKTTKFQSDPTASGVPLLAANPEQKLFSNLRKYRFDDGTQLDFRGDAELSVNNRKGTLGNSNERGSKGFVTTFALPRTIGIKGTYKLDWIFVKGYLKDDSNGGDSYRFAPRFARTMNEVNQAFDQPLSDHAAISVDLPITQSLGPGSPK
jgi:endonuclease/exonuclease/phosphatase family metal-dependent hydrolase